MDDKEFEMLLDEIPYTISLNLHRLYQHHHQQQHNYHNYVQTVHAMDDSSCHPKYMCVSPVSGLSLKSEGSSSHSGAISFFNDGLTNPPPLEGTKFQMPPGNTHHSSGLRLESKLPDFTIGDEQVDSSLIGFPFTDPCLVKTSHGNVEKNGGSFEDCRKTSFDCGGLQCSFPASPMSFDEERRSKLLGLPHGYQMGNLSGSSIAHDQFSSLFPQLGHYTGLINSSHSTSDEFLSNLQLQAWTDFDKNCNNMGTWIPNGFPSIISPLSNVFFYSQQNGMDSNGDGGILNSPPPHLTHLNLPLGLEHLRHYSLPKSNGRARANPNFCIPQYVSSTRNAWDLQAFNCEDSLILQGECLNYVRNKSLDFSREHKKHSCNEIGPSQLNSRGIPSFHFEDSCSPTIYSPLPPKYNSSLEVRRSIYFMAKDQHGCRFLQKKFDEGTPQDVQMIFNEIIDHVVELMMNPFGNYLMQKLLDVCDEEQRLQILLMVTRERSKLVEISLNTYGTRVVQKLIETLKTRHQVSLIISALEAGFIDLINDLNGNHVLQRCLHCLSNEDNKFIFDAATKYCLDIATHRHGCCVLQRCIAHSTGEHQEKLVAEISANGLHIAQNDFGNYVIQYILEMKFPSATANLISQFEGNYVHLSMQKFSSNVVQKCLNVFDEENRSSIIHELLSSYQFEQLLQDPFANYVIQSALQVSKGPLHASLVGAIRSHAASLRTNLYSKKIFSKTLLRK